MLAVQTTPISNAAAGGDRLHIVNFTDDLENQAMSLIRSSQTDALVTSGPFRD